ncbi:hypothetical protein [Nonomuraea sp. SBT364]|uniref:hypothetical protein n=1 Tax=Nonomuraea sp. SBT364 TaxID=1580530 RepID=UPI000A7A4B79|nr:hypothetical protein [Nonomuraea sp. SBT364]
MKRLATIVVLAALTSCGPGEEERITRSFTKMEQVAQALKPEGSLTNRPLEVGQVEFQAVYREGDRVYFKVGENGPSVDPYGYVWSPERTPVDDSNPAVASSFEHIQGPWYRWSDSY